MGKVMLVKNVSKVQLTIRKYKDTNYCTNPDGMTTEMWKLNGSSRNKYSIYKDLVRVI